MKSFLSICLAVLFSTVASAQEVRQGKKIVSASLGVSMANLLNSEAPYKLNIPGSDIQPILFENSDITASSRYIDYSTSLYRDIKIGVAAKVGVEYFLSEKLSLTSSIAYEVKGIDLRYSRISTTEITVSTPDPDNPYATTDATRYESYSADISNSYLSLPVTVRRYFSQYFYVSAGAYAGLLMDSEAHTDQRKYYNVEGYYESTSYNELDHDDRKKEYTNHFDYGIMIGTGVSYPLNNKLLLNVDLSIASALRKIDRKYSNEFESRGLPTNTGWQHVVRSTNYYGLNSNARNINAAFTVGVGRKF